MEWKLEALHVIGVGAHEILMVVKDKRIKDDTGDKSDTTLLLP